MIDDQFFVTKKVAEHGPIFKTMWNDRYTTCVYGNERIRRLLVDNDNMVPGTTTDLTGLFAIGAMRGMNGEDHKKYRRLFVLAVQATPFADHESIIRAWILDRLNAMARASADHVVDAQTLRVDLRDIATGIMLRMMYGVEPGTPEYAALLADYRILGPKAPVYKIMPDNAEAFRRIRVRIEKLVEEIRRGPMESFPRSYLRHLLEIDSLDETMLGNLIYLHETSHFDVFSLWRWMLRMLASHPKIQERVRAASGSALRELSEAIVNETLRCEQVEELYRAPTTDVVFEGCLIPRDSIMRGRLWESHKDPKTFPDPYSFNPDRFIGRTYPIEQFAPFGLDKRRCVGSNFVIELSTMFVETLLKNFSLSVAADGPPVYGAYHWEPAPNFAIALTPVAGAALSAARA